MKKYLYMAAALLMAVACNWKDEMVDPEELGAQSKSIELSCVAGSVTLGVYADGDFSAALPSDAAWIHFENGGRSFSGKGDTGIILSYDINRGVARSTVISLRRGRKYLEIPVIQAGILSAGIEFEDRNVTAGADASSCSIKIITLCKDSDLSFEVSYKGEQSGWIDAIRKVNNFLSFDVIENSGAERRFASIKAVSKSDPTLFDEVEICQLGAGTALEAISLTQMKALATKDGDNLILGSKVIEGTVIGDNLAGNGAPNINLSPSLQDLTLADRTVYIQDGETGVKLVFDKIEDNTLRRYDRVRILLDSLTLVRHSDPSFYELRGAGSEAILSSTAGDAFSVPENKKTIGELTDADINTWVTLTGVEIPIRKGPYFPIDTRHKHVISRFPMPIRDAAGNSMHLVTNYSAEWQRDGTGMPEGAGDISGILVHETFDNFGWDPVKAMQLEQSGRVAEYITELGEIGRYQIRPVRKEDIALARNFGDGFSDMIMEVRYYNKSYDNIVKNSVNNTIYSTYPAVEQPTSTGAVKGVLEVYSGSSKASVGGYRDWTHLGPMVGDEIADPAGGNGVYDYFGNSAHFDVAASTTKISGYIADANGSAWYCSSWTTSKCWRAQFSTEGLTAENLPLSVQFGLLQGLGRTVGAPRYWVAEWSFTGSSWTQFGEEFTVPDFPIISNRKIWQSPGPKYMTINLPMNTNLVGKANVYVRIRPSQDKAATTNTYDGGSIDGAIVSQMNYFAIRYNK